jgi:DNA-binding NarL/FixJ family response regulator
MNKIKVIIVDDHEIFRDGLKQLLENITEIEIVAEAANGEQFLEELVIHQPDLVFMDIEMPRMNGIEATIKAKKINKNVNIIALTSFDDKIYLKKMFESGVNGYMLKNSDKFEFKKAIYNINNGKEYISYDLLQDMSGKSMLSELTENKIAKDFSLNLSTKEKVVLEGICQGKLNDEIAKELKVSVRTIEGYRSKLLTKTDCKNTAQLIVFAIKHKIVDTPA